MDRRLVWNQIAAPDLSGASAAIARANQSFNTGIDAASSTLSAYNAAQQESNDNELLGELAGLKDENALDAFLQNTNFNDRNISSDLKNTILGRRDEIIGYNQGRADIQGTNARTAGTLTNTAIARASEGRNASEFNYQNQRRNELAGLSGAIVNANREGNEFGVNGQSGVQTKVYQGLLDRGLPEHVAQGFMMNFQDESGFNIDITEGEDNVHGTRGKGLYQLTGSRRDAFEAKYGNDYSIDNQLDWLMSELSGSESSAGNAILNTTNAGEAGSAIVSKFLRPAEEHRLTRSNSYLNGNGFALPTDQNQTPNFDALSDTLGNSSTLTPADISGLLGGAFSAQQAGQGRLDAAEANRINGIQDQAVVDAFGNPTINGDPNSVIAAALGQEGISAGDQLELLGRLQGTVENNQGVFNPQAPVDPITEAAIAAEQAAAQREIDTDPQRRLLAEAENYEADPAKSIIDRFELDENVSSREDIDRAVDLMADRMNLTRGQAAVALAENYTGEPGFFSRDNLANRFDSNAAIRLATDTFGPDARTRGDDNRIATNRRNSEFESSQARLAELQSEALRYQSTGDPVPEETAREITKLQDNLRAGTTPGATQIQLETYLSRTGTASRLEGLDPNSAEFFRAVSDLETQIQGDRTLDANEKRLLLSALRG